MTIPRLSKEEMKQPIPCETPRVDYEGPEKPAMPMAAMHFLMDFVSCIGTLMADSGLKEILSTTFGSIDKMLQGKTYPQNVRALRLLTEELLRPVLEKHNVRLTSMDDLEMF